MSKTNELNGIIYANLSFYCRMLRDKTGPAERVFGYGVLGDIKKAITKDSDVLTVKEEMIAAVASLFYWSTHSQELNTAPVVVSIKQAILDKKAAFLAGEWRMSAAEMWRAVEQNMNAENGGYDGDRFRMDSLNKFVHMVYDYRGIKASLDAVVLKANFNADLKEKVERVRLQMLHALTNGRLDAMQCIDLTAKIDTLVGQAQQGQVSKEAIQRFERETSKYRCTPLLYQALAAFAGAFIGYVVVGTLIGAATGGVGLPIAWAVCGAAGAALGLTWAHMFGKPMRQPLLEFTKAAQAASSAVTTAPESPVEVTHQRSASEDASLLEDQPAAVMTI